ncbi:MAG: DUF2190 family protein [Desulfovibrio sp.]|jgi:predicted RecA/RadA family phage recombinase|nr:DUF2190 family protein [Desulfovibrio sp.]
MTNYVRNGKTITLLADEDVKGGDLVLFPGMVAVASTDIPAGKIGACDTEGVFDLGNKSAGAIQQGETVYAAADGTLSAYATSGVDEAVVENLRVGVAWVAAATAATTVQVKINA